MVWIIVRLIKIHSKNQSQTVFNFRSMKLQLQTKSNEDKLGLKNGLNLY